MFAHIRNNTLLQTNSGNDVWKCMRSQSTHSQSTDSVEKKMPSERKCKILEMAKNYCRYFMPLNDDRTSQWFIPHMKCGSHFRELPLYCTRVVCVARGHGVRLAICDVDIFRASIEPFTKTELFSFQFNGNQSDSADADSIGHKGLSSRIFHIGDFPFDRIADHHKTQ